MHTPEISRCYLCRNAKSFVNLNFIWTSDSEVRTPTYNLFKTFVTFLRWTRRIGTIMFQKVLLSLTEWDSLWIHSFSLRSPKIYFSSNALKDIDDQHICVFCIKKAYKRSISITSVVFYLQKYKINQELDYFASLFPIRLYQIDPRELFHRELNIKITFRRWPELETRHVVSISKILPSSPYALKQLST